MNAVGDELDGKRGLLRPLVIARKISFGSQSDAWAKTREILMTVLHTLSKRAYDVTISFKCSLDKLADWPNIDPYEAVFGLDTSYCPNSPPVADPL